MLGEEGTAEHPCPSSAPGRICAPGLCELPQNSGGGRTTQPKKQGGCPARIKIPFCGSQRRELEWNNPPAVAGEAAAADGRGRAGREMSQRLREGQMAPQSPRGWEPRGDPPGVTLERGTEASSRCRCLQAGQRAASCGAAPGSHCKVQALRTDSASASLPMDCASRILI